MVREMESRLRCDEISRNYNVRDVGVLPHHQRQAWESYLYRIANDIDRETGPVMKKYGRNLMAEKTAMGEYKREDNSAARKFF